MPNELTNGTRRTGDLYDSYPDTPEVKVTLERSDAGISVTIAWSTPEVPYADWFLRDGGYISGTEPARSLPVPTRVLFHDSHGSVLLIRCWAHGFHANSFGPGSGTLWAKAAVLGVEQVLEFERPHGVQSEISGLRQWLGVTSWDQQLSSRHPLEVTVSSVQTPPIEVGNFGGLQLRLLPTWQLIPESSSDRLILRDVVQCVSLGSDPKDWDTHMHLHRAVRDLLVASRWRSESCVPKSAMRNDDPLVTLDGTLHGDQWREVVVSDDERSEAPISWTPHLIEYGDLGPNGLTRWIRLRDEFARALDPLISSIDLRDATASTLLAHAGPGVEALGYLLLLRDGQPAVAAARAPLKLRLDRILDDVRGCLPFDGPAWATRTVRAYNGLKHANRAMPDDMEIMQAWAESVMVLRAWVALELGVGRPEVKARLENDRQPRRFERVP